MSVRSLSWRKVIPALLLFLSFLPGAEAAQARPAKLSVEYVYAPDGTLAGRTVNGQVQRFEYDKRGQLLAVKDVAGKDLERYTYDSAGNILSKTVHGKTTRFTYDAANQITSRTNPDGSVVQYRYDAAGRLVQEGTRSYVYGYQDKVEAIRENGKTVARFTYGLDGQLESVTRADGSVEHFHWDGLALIGRGKSTFINEPYVTGGNPIASDGKAMLNDMLGSTVGIRDGEKMTPVSMTAFGESTDQGAMYTGKPHVDGLGYAFLFRNYRAELGKWQTADPFGYPDGWNQLTYVNNDSINNFDFLGGLTAQEKQIYIMNQLNTVAKSNLSHNIKAQALLNATLSDNTNPLVQYITNASDSISNLNSALPAGAPGKGAVDALANYLSAGKNISQAIELANNQDPRFMSNLLELSGAKNVPGIGSYIDFIDGAINAIAAGISQIKLNETMQNIDWISDPIIGDFSLTRIIDSQWLVSKSTYEKILRKLQE